MDHRWVQAGLGAEMHGYWRAIWLLIGIFAVCAPASGQRPGAQEQVRALLVKFPSGGPGLRAEIARLVEADPASAKDVVAVARDARPEQQQAIGEGLADAANFYAKISSDWARIAQAEIETAIRAAPADVVAGFTLAGPPPFARAIPGPGVAAPTTSGCVSPSGSGRSCR